MSLTVTSDQSRRSLLKRGLLLAAGAAGVSAASADAAIPATLRLHGVNWRLTTPDRKAGDAIQLGDHGALHGDLLDRPAGKTLGRLYGSRLAIQSGGGGFERADASVEVHTFVLDGGTIVGMGTPVHGRAVFAIVGGTGRYAGVSGSYTAQQRLREQGGNGTADFDFNLRS